MGCSSLTGRCWSGSVWVYDDPLQAPDIAASQASYQMQAGTKLYSSFPRLLITIFWQIITNVRV